MLKPLHPSTKSNREMPFSKRQIKALALPVEHGVWGFWLEPTLLGLVLAFSWAGVSLAFAVLAALLLQHPLVLYLNDILRNKSYSRTRLAFFFVLGYGSMAFGLTFLSIVLAGTITFLLPLVAILPLVMYQFRARVAHQGRQLFPELAGAAALNALVASLVLITSASIWWALVLWLVLLARTLPTILYIRARLRLERGETINRLPSLLSVTLAVAVITTLVEVKLLPALLVLFFLLLFIRTALGLSVMRLSLKAKHIGMLELGIGLLLVGAFVLSP